MNELHIIAGATMFALACGGAFMIRDDSLSFNSKIPRHIEALIPKDNRPVDIGLAAIVLSSEISPVSVSEYNSKIDSLVEKVKAASAGALSPIEKISRMNGVFFLDEQLHYDEDFHYGAPQAESGEHQSTITKLLDTKAGNCFSLPVLYIAVAQRLGYPIYAVSTPGHLSARYEDSFGNIHNIETTDNGGPSSDEKYMKDFAVSSETYKKGSYLKTLSSKELFGLMLASVGLYLHNKGDFELAGAYTKRATELVPTDPEPVMQLAMVYQILSIFRPDNEATRFYDEALRLKRSAYAMGYVNPRTTPTAIHAMGEDE